MDYIRLEIPYSRDILFLSTTAPYNINGIPILTMDIDIDNSISYSQRMYNRIIFQLEYTRYSRRHYEIDDISNNLLTNIRNLLGTSFTFSYQITTEIHIACEKEFADFLQRNLILYNSRFLGYEAIGSNIMLYINQNQHYSALTCTTDCYNELELYPRSRGNRAFSSIIDDPADEFLSPFNNNYITNTTAMLNNNRILNNSVATFASAKEYVHKHDYKPTYNAHKLPEEENPLYLGAEIEIDKGGQDNHEVMGKCLSIMNSDENNKKETYIYGMHDGSLSLGFEIATMPATLLFHKTLPYKEMFDYLISQGYRAHDTQTCGLHVHINRNFFGESILDQQLCISGLTYLVETYWNEIVTISRRDSNRYSSRFNKKKEDTILNMFSKVTNGSKYSAINLQHNNTIELRMFKGTLNYNTFINTLEFVHILANIVKNTNIYNIDKITWEDIYNHFSDELKEYYNTRKNKRAVSVTSSESDYRFFETTDTNRCNRNATVFTNDLFNASTTVNSSIGIINERISENFRNLINSCTPSPVSSLELLTETDSRLEPMVESNESSLPTTEKNFKQKIKRLKKDLKAAQRRNDYLSVVTIERELSDTQRTYNNYKRRNRHTNVA